MLSKAYKAQMDRQDEQIWKLRNTGRRKLTYKQIMEKMQISEPTVKRALKRYEAYLQSQQPKRRQFQFVPVAVSPH